MSSLTGQTISHYKIITKVGQGGMGEVYKAEDTKLKRLVAMKFLLETTLSDDQDKLRFFQEAQATAKLDHINICTVYEIDEVKGRTYIVMAFIEGMTLKEKIREKTLELHEMIDIGIQITKGLREAHEHGIVHRDIKSANIMLTPKGLIKVTDFGVAKVLEGPRLTKVGSTVGTLGYMSPEQIKGRAVDHRSDIWSLGILFYEMLTTRRPFNGNDFEIMSAVMNDEPIPLNHYRADIPQELEVIIEKCIQKNPDDRFQNLTDLIVELARIWKDHCEPEGHSSSSIDSLNDRTRLISNSAELKEALAAHQNENKKKSKTGLYAVLVVLFISIIGFLKFSGIFPFDNQSNIAELSDTESPSSISETPENPYKSQAENAYQNVLNAEKNARKNNALIKAKSTFQKATELQSKGTNEFTSGNFEPAFNFFSEAVEEYQNAEKLAKATIKPKSKNITKTTPIPVDASLAERQNAIHAKRRMGTAKLNAQDVNADGNESYIAAEQKEKLANSRYSQKRYTNAEAVYIEATKLFNAAVKDAKQVAENESSKDDLRAKTQKANAETAYENLKKVKFKLDPSFEGFLEYQNGLQAEKAGQTYFTNSNFIQAKQEYEKASSFFNNAIVSKNQQIERLDFAIERYKLALEGKNIKQLRNVYPNLDKETEKNWIQFFKSARDLSVDVNTKNYNIAPTNALVNLDIKYIYGGAGGSAVWNSFKMQFQKNNSKWIISDIIKN